MSKLSNYLIFFSNTDFRINQEFFTDKSDYINVNVKFPRTGLYPEGVKNKISPDVDIVLTWYLRWAHFMGQTSLSKFLVNMIVLTKNVFFCDILFKTSLKMAKNRLWG